MSLYIRLGQPVREGGSRLVAGFLEDKQVVFTPAALESIFNGCEWTYRNRGCKPIADQRCLARILVPAIEALAAQDEAAAAMRLRSAVVQKTLSATLNRQGESELRPRAARLLIKVNSYPAIPALLNAVPLLDDGTAKSVLDWTIRTLANPGIAFSPRRNMMLLARMAVAARGARRRTGLPLSVAARLEKVGERINIRLNAATKAAAKRGKEGRRRVVKARSPSALPPPALGAGAASADSVQTNAAP